MTAWLDGGDKGWMWLMGVGRTGESPGQMWRGEEREPDTAGKMSCQSHLSNLGVENAHCLMHLPTLPLQAGFQRSQVKLRAVKFWASPPPPSLVFIREGQLYDFFLIHAFSYTEMTKKKRCSALRDLCFRETCSITPIPNTNTFSSLPIKLMSPTYPKTMEREWTLLNYFSVSLEQLSKSQAILKDYKNLTGLNRGHLNPSSHHRDSSSRTATFTLTNIVPQNEKLNGGAWNNYEQQTMTRRTQGCNTTYVVVGAVPGNNYIAKGRVNKPSHIWSSACCEVDTNRRKAWAVIAENDKNEVQLLTLGELEDVLTQLYGRDQVSLFHRDCPRE